MKPTRICSCRAFTLVEAMIATTICGFVMAGIMTLYIYALQNNFVSEQRLLANDDVRTFTETMVKNARASNSLVLYQSYYPYTPANNTYPFTGTMATAVTPFQPQTPSNTTTLDVNDEIPPGNAGDYLVFISYTDPFITYAPAAGANPLPAIPPTQVSRLIMYWVAPNNNFPGQYAVYMFDTGIATAAAPITTPWNVVLPATLSTPSALEGLLPTPPAAWTAASAPLGSIVVLNDVRGLIGYIPATFNAFDVITTPAVPGLGLNFINYSNKQNTSILMRTLILHGNAAKRVTDTYNFTITPGG
jgi:type II secretory pathway pseudopilin PulG